MGAFGEKLRKQREQRGIALDTISSVTKISTRMLRALEDEHFDQLPGGVFNKGFVRAYARQVGLDEEEAVTDYLAALRENQIQAQSILPDFRDLGNHDLRNNDLRNHALPDNVLPGNDGSGDGGNELRREDRRKEDRRHKDLSSLPDSTTHAPAANPAAERFPKKYPAGSPVQPADEPSARIPWGKLAVALLLVTLALAFWNSRRHGEPTAASQPAASSHQFPAPVSEPASAATQPSGAARSLTVGKASPAGTLSSGTIPPTTTPPTPTRASTTLPAAPAPASSGKAASPAASTPASTTGSASEPVSKTAANPPGAGANPVAKDTALAAAAKPPGTFTLLIRAEKTSWVSIVADGKPVAHETLIAPAHTSVRASREIVIKAGNAAGISFLLNGKEIPAQGNDGEVKTYVFDATTVHVVPQTQPPTTNR